MKTATEIIQAIQVKEESSSPLIACGYVRCVAKNELAVKTQVDGILSYVKSHPNIVLSEIYVDDGFSGMATDRPAFNKMLDEIRNLNIDLVIVKDLSRLHRNEAEILSLICFAEEFSTHILTLNDRRIHSFSNESAMIRFIKDIDEVSGRITARELNRVRIENRELTARDVCFGFGWNKELKDVEINLEEARIVKYIFEEYVNNLKSVSELRSYIEGAYKYMSESTVRSILKNEKYLGKFYINRFTTYYPDQKVISLPKEDWVLVEREDLRIISDDLFKKALQRLSGR